MSCITSGTNKNISKEFRCEVLTKDTFYHGVAQVKHTKYLFLANIKLTVD